MSRRRDGRQMQVVRRIRRDHRKRGVCHYSVNWQLLPDGRVRFAGYGLAIVRRPTVVWHTMELTARKLEVQEWSCSEILGTLATE